MNRLIFIVSLFAISFLFTQCNPCGKNPSPRIDVIGMKNFSSKIISIYSDNESSSIDSFGIFITAEFILAKSHVFSLFTPVYACSPVETYPSDIKPDQVDSIHVASEPTYSENARLDSLLYFNYSETIADYNASQSNNVGLSTRLYFKQPPTQSDSFTFSFYYYKDGAIIDSSSTQKFYISS